jgi:hypothetical protein
MLTVSPPALAVIWPVTVACWMIARSSIVWWMRI